VVINRRAEVPHLIFDLGGVLVENVGYAALQALLPGHPEPAHLRERWLGSSLARAFETGRIAPDEFASRFVREWEIDLSPEAFITAFKSWPKGFYPGAETLLRDLRRRYPVSCLSNSNVLHWGQLEGWATLFDPVFVSHLTGEIKPDPSAFLQVIEKLGVSPAQIYFFDDAPPNVAAARQLGIQAFHVDGFAALRALLQSPGVLPA
jgi:glucose-1-phosphatase